MRDWQGYHLEVSELGDGNIATCENVSFEVRYEIRRRYGLKPCEWGDTRNFGDTATTIRNVAFFTYLGTTKLVRHDASAGEVQAIDLYGGTPEVLDTGLTDDAATFYNANGRLYFLSLTARRVYSSGVGAESGITGPSAAPSSATAGGNCTIGTHLIRYRYKDSETGYVSNPSPILSVSLTVASQITLTMVQTADTKVDYYTVEMTLAGGSTFYKVADAVESGTTYIINVTDAVLSTQQLANIYAGPDGYGHEPPPYGNIACEHRGRVFIWNGTYLYWSRAGFPESFNITNWARSISTTNGEDVAALRGFQSDLYAFTASSIKRLVYTDDPGNGMMLNVSSAHGVWNHRCLCMAEGDLYGFGPQGMFRIAGIKDEHISRPIDAAWRTEIDRDLATPNHFIFYEPKERTVYFMYLTDDTTQVPTMGFALELQTRQWKKVSYLQGISGAVTGGTTSDAVAAYLFMAGDVAPVYEVADNFFDGVPASMSSGVVTTASGCTTTVLNVNETLPTPNGISGAQLYVPSTGLSYQILSNTAGAITLNDALPGAPAAGVTYYIGPILVSCVSDWVMRGRMDQVSSPAWLQVDHLSDTAAMSVEFKVYKNFSATPENFAILSADDTWPLGVTVTNANSVTIDTGEIGPSIPLPFSDAKVYRWSFTQSEPTGTFKLVDVNFVADEPGRERIE